MPAVSKTPVQDQYQSLYDDFVWHVPTRFNIAEVCSRRWAADPERIALLCDDESGEHNALTYQELHYEANRLSNALRYLGIGQQQCVAIILPQRAETASATPASSA